MAAPSSPRVLNIGLIGCGEVSQAIHIPTLLAMRARFRITYLCDVSPSALAHCAAGIPTNGAGIRTTRDPEELCGSPEVDAVLVATSDEYHAAHAVVALRHGKHVLVEKPLALTKRDVQTIIDAERQSKGKVMVGYMRRYAAPFEDAVKEIGGLGEVVYARVRDIIGPNSTFVSQSGTFPQQFTDFSAEDSADKTARAEEQVRHALETECGGVAVTPELTRMWHVLGGLGSHDLSVMREALGMPERVIGASLRRPIWNVLFQYPQGFTVSYESGMINVPQFDAHLEVYGRDKIVRVQYDTPYIKGLPVTLHITEAAGPGSGELRQTTIRKTYEDPYTIEWRRFWEFVVEGKAVKTTAEDALQDLEVFTMIVRHGAGGNSSAAQS
ncbi:hypothetical protein Micbo1qcDRAFT_231189 [Microdochium bolleyi]|uniref:Gfo/Idh/MocA-like oxidoreductase N-terminal domain-containing protein n=1 Tax=Microdochium bolleyi TaxID=196109 RepID=A0A136JG15_9PEZI|nr:hypothetical protein Micbo1qcDRAFT_231189 [Microdochium bolleyi]